MRNAHLRVIDRISRVIYYSFNCRDRLRHALLLLFGLILDNKWELEICGMEKKENGSGTMLDKRVHLRQYYALFRRRLFIRKTQTLM